MRVGVDTGGTFTDIVALDANGTMRVAKVSSTGQDAARALIDGVTALLDGTGLTEITVGTTVATNALLERKGGPTALVTTRGFEDVLVLRRQARPLLYALVPEVAPPLVPDAARLGAEERLDAAGQVIVALDDAEIARVVEAVRALGVESVAVCLLHSPMNAAHEGRLASALAELGVHVSRSSEVAPIPREYERTSTTVVDAYVAPRVSPYVSAVSARFGAPRVRVLQSTGGAVEAERARKEPVRTVLSGPSGGVIAARAIAAMLGEKNVITLDMGGTSTDVALIEEGEPAQMETTELAGAVLQLPMLAVHTIGAGGGSIARLDAGGALCVGPESAGAHPGPAAYGRGGRAPTVTDADVVLGRLPADARLGGALALDGRAAHAAVETLASTFGGVREAAHQIIALAELKIAGAIRRITVERGRDPRDFALLAFGGAGPLHAVSVARELGIARVIVPPEPGLLCAWGALAADLVHERVLTVQRDASSVDDVTRARYRDELKGQLSYALRYEGQSFELIVGDQIASLTDGFIAAHRARYGYVLDGRKVELVSVRARSVRPADASPFTHRALAAGTRFEGERSIVEMSATTYLPPGARAEVHATGALVIS